MKHLIRKAFGDKVFNNTQINRKKLGNMVFKDKNKLKTLNSIIHPQLISEIKKILHSKTGKIVLDAALLFYWGLEKECNLSILLKARKDVKIQRLKQRGIEKSKALAILSQQEDEKDWEKKADIVFDNSNGLEELKKFAETIDRLVLKEYIC